ncbi:MAG: hypothetical protein H7099_00905 [Gemmatimonadaceae bacterium]|nr:hypothetical protein [Gemmatimonadaceae bacterium]
MCVVAMLSGVTACTTREDARDQAGSQDVVRSEGPEAEPAIADSGNVTGSLTVSAAQPTAGDGVVQVYRRAPLVLPGATAAFSMHGVAGALRHGFLVVLDSAGIVKVVTHKWSNADNSIVAQTDCGARRTCPAEQVIADRKTGAVTFNGLVLTGLDGNTGDPATSTITGRVP